MVVFHIKRGSAVYLREDKKEIDWALNVTGTSEFRHRSINDLSGGGVNEFGLQWHWLKNRHYFPR